LIFVLLARGNNTLGMLSLAALVKQHMSADVRMKITARGRALTMITAGLIFTEIFQVMDMKLFVFR